MVAFILKYELVLHCKFFNSQSFYCTIIDIALVFQSKKRKILPGRALKKFINTVGVKINNLESLPTALF